MDLPRTIEMPDGEILTPLHPEDVFEAVEEYAGKEVRDLIDEYIAEELGGAVQAAPLLYFVFFTGR